MLPSEIHKEIRLSENQSAGYQLPGDQEKEDRNFCPDALIS